MCSLYSVLAVQCAHCTVCRLRFVLGITGNIFLICCVPMFFCFCCLFLGAFSVSPRCWIRFSGVWPISDCVGMLFFPGKGFGPGFSLCSVGPLALYWGCVPRGSTGYVVNKIIVFLTHDPQKHVSFDPLASAGVQPF